MVALWFELAADFDLVFGVALILVSIWAIRMMTLVVFQRQPQLELHENAANLCTPPFAAETSYHSSAGRSIRECTSPCG